MDDFANPLASRRGQRQESAARPAAGLYSRADADRARIMAEAVARGATAIGETLAAADQALRHGLEFAARGDYAAGRHELSRALIASALAVWQTQQLVAEATARRDAAAAYQFRAAAERLLAELPGRARVAANALAASPAGNACIAEVRATLLAFAHGGGLAGEPGAGGTEPAWLRALAAAFDPVPAGVRDASAGTPPALASDPRLAVAGGRRGRRRNGKLPLSNREREVLELIVAGMNTQEIAYRLGVKATTISTLVGRIFNKLGVNNRPAAVAIALRHGLCGGFDDLAA